MNLLFDFDVNKETKTINITREFAAGLDLVWDAFTKPEILALWHAPKPFTLYTKEMNFSEGGRWLYTMISPGASIDSNSRYSMVEYLKINPKTYYSSRNTFTDENGNSTSSAFSITTNSFKEGDGKTTVYIEKKFEDLAVLEMMASNGFIEGTAAGFANLEEYLSTITTSK